MSHRPYSLYELVFPNGKRYFGITHSPDERLAKHWAHARGGSPLAVHRAIAKYGEVRQRILCIGHRQFIAELEVAMIARCQTRDRKRGYNISAGGDISPMHAPEVAKRMSETKRARMMNPAYKAKATRPAIEASMRPDVRARILERIRSPEVSAAKTAKMKGRSYSPETLERMRLAQSDPEHRASLSEKVRAAWSCPKLRAEQSARKKGQVVTPEQRAKISASLMGHPGVGKGEKRPEISEMLRGLVWITDEVSSRRVPKGSEIPQGWRLGRPLGWCRAGGPTEKAA